MGEHRAPKRARQAAQAAQTASERYARKTGRGRSISAKAPAITQAARPAQRCQRPASVVKAADDAVIASKARRRRRNRAAAAAPRRSPRFQASSGPNGHGHQQRHHQRPEGEVEKGRADGNLVAGQSLRAPADRACRRGRVAQAVVRKRLLNTSAPSRLIGANRPPCLQHRRAQREQGQRAADEDAQDARMKTPRVGIGREGMHRGQHARAHEEGAEQRQREGEDARAAPSRSSAPRAFP